MCELLFNYNLLNINLVGSDDSYKVSTSLEVVVESHSFTIHNVDVASFNNCTASIDELVGCIAFDVAEVDADTLNSIITTDKVTGTANADAEISFIYQVSETTTEDAEGGES